MRVSSQWAVACPGRIALAAITMALSFGALAWCEEPPSPSKKTEELQREYVERVGAEFDTVVDLISHDLYHSDPFFSSVAAVNPDGRLAALALSRDEKGENRWSVLILNSTTLEVTQVYDFIKAYHLNRMEWSPDGGYLLVLAEDVNLSGPPGSLSVIDPTTKQAFVIDRGVFQYALSPKAQELVYEKAVNPDEPFGKREIYHSSFEKLLATLRDPQVSTQATPKQHAELVRQQATHRLLELDYPKEQLEGFKSWSGDGKSLHMTVYRYGAGATRAARVRFVLDLNAGEAREVH